MTEIVERLERQAVNVENDGHVSAARAMREAATALTEARAEIVSLRTDLGETQLVLEQTEKNAERKLDELRADIATLRARVREVVGPFAEQADGARLCGAELDDDWKPFLHRSYTEVDITNGHLRAARQLMEGVK